MSLRDTGVGVDGRPWVETHGYRPLSLRDTMPAEALCWGYRTPASNRVFVVRGCCGGIPVSLTRHGRGADDRPWTEVHGYRPLSLTRHDAEAWTPMLHADRVAVTDGSRGF